MLEGKRTARKQLQALSFSEKVRALEKPRDRSLAITRSQLRTRRRSKI